jgi:hypothetical protein
VPREQEESSHHEEIAMTRASITRLTTALLGLLLAAPAAAQDWIDEYEYDFAAHPAEDFSGTDGWVSGYNADRWTTAWFADYGEVNPTTDDSGGQWSGNGAINNHLCQEDEGPWRNASVEAQFIAMDDDALGLVIRKSASATFYLFFMSNHSMPPAGSGGESVYEEGAFLYRVEDGYADQVATSNTSYEVQGGNEWGYQRFRIEAVDDTITAYYADDESGPWTGGTEILSWTDPSPLPEGHVGLYSYNSGETNGNVGFRYPLVQLADSDSDGTPDDQEGTGDDDDDDTTDDDDDVSDDDDATDDDDDATDDDDSAQAGDDDDLVLIQNANDCGCRQATTAGTGSAVMGLLLMAGALVLRRR